MRCRVSNSLTIFFLKYGVGRNHRNEFGHAWNFWNMNPIPITKERELPPPHRLCHSLENPVVTSLGCTKIRNINLLVGKSKPQTSLLLVLVMPTDSISQCIDVVYLNCSSFVFSYNVLLSQHISLPLVFECIVATENAGSRYTLPWY